MNTALYCVIGNPVEHSRSPWIHARFAQLTGQPIEYGRRLAQLDGFAQSLRALRAQDDGRARGCNVTVPFKFEAAQLAQRLSARAQLAQAANTLRFDTDGIYGDNTDGIGLVNDITAHAGIALAGRDVLLIGAGGAAAGALGPLLEAGARRVVIANRTPQKAAALAQRHAALAQMRQVQLQAQPLDGITGAFAIVINATAASLCGAAIPVRADVLAPGALALDMMYGPAAHGFMTWAREHGAAPRDGLGMLVEQAAQSFLLWRGVRPPTAQVLSELRAIVG
ncbi:MAG: shikimate dehydrogenase [Burkholderiaceae bacterium]|jgi:shikimate dehydrogenase|nr:shikimate dehydrogenase [Burkholderiaceae bacterium]